MSQTAALATTVLCRSCVATSCTAHARHVSSLHAAALICRQLYSTMGTLISRLLALIVGETAPRTATPESIADARKRLKLNPNHVNWGVRACGLRLAPARACVHALLLARWCR